MVKEIRWTQEAFDTFNGFVDHLSKQKTERDAVDFVKSADKVLAYISQRSTMFRRTNKMNLREAYVFQRVYLVYIILRQNILVVAFFTVKSVHEKEEVVIYLS